MEQVYSVLVSKPKECKKTFNAEVQDEVDGEILYGVGNTAKEAIEDLAVMVDEVNASRERRGKCRISPSFGYKFDVAALFSFYAYLNISEVAKRIGINPSLMRRYASGETVPSEARLREIESQIKLIANELKEVSLMTERKSHNVA